MKNKSVERLKTAAKLYHRTRRGDHFDNGIMIFHRYDPSNLNQMSWWDDVTFVLNNYRVALAWVHPRMAFEDRIESEADRLTSALSLPCSQESDTPIYKKVGKSRKKISKWQRNVVDRSEWLEQWQRARQQVIRTTDHVIVPTLTSRWCKYSRLVNLCVPLEVRNEDDLRRLATLAKKLLKREVTLEQLFPGYRYTKMDWEREGLHLTSGNLHTHQVVP